MIESQLKCRFCDYRVSQFYTGKDGRRHTGFTRLRQHIEREHEEQADEIDEKSHTARSDEVTAIWDDETTEN